MDIAILVNIFNCYGSILSIFPEKEKRKNCFSADWKILDEYINMKEFNQSFLLQDLLAIENPI